MRSASPNLDPTSARQDWAPIEADGAEQEPSARMLAGPAWKHEVMSWDEAFADRYEEWSADMTVDTGWMDDSTRASVVAQQPTGRLGTPEDVANLVASYSRRRAIGSTGSFSTATVVFRRGTYRSERAPG